MPSVRKSLWWRILDKGTTAALVVLLVLGILAISPASLVARFTVDVQLAKGVAEIDAELSNLRHPLLVIGLLADDTYMAMSHFAAYDKSGAAKGMIGWGRWRVVWAGLADTVHLRYDARLGVKGRHGYQGRIEEHFALLPTRLLMWLPQPRWSISEVQLKVDAPPEQEVLCPWPQDNQGWFAAKVSTLHPFVPVSETACAVGPFDVSAFVAGGQKIEIATHRSFSPDLRQRIHHRAKTIFAHNQKLLNFELRSRYLNIFVPRAADGGRVFGSSWTLGHTYEMEPETTRRWELFGHRVGHVFNRDRPYGMKMGQLRDRWFYEALASWLEVPMSEVGGSAQDDGRFGNLFWRYWTRRVKEGPRLDFPPDEDAWVRGHKAIEWLHYTKFPLVLVMLDHTLRGSEADPERGVQGLFAFLYQRYGNHREPIPDLQTEIEAFSGQDLDWFFDRYVKSDWPLLPLWRSVLVKAHRRQSRLPVVAHLAGEPIWGDGQVLRLAAQKPSVARTHLDTLIHTQAMGIVIKRLGLRDIPEELCRLTAALPAHGQAAVAAHRRRALREYLSGRGLMALWSVDGFVADQLAKLELTLAPQVEQAFGAISAAPTP